MIKAHTEVQIIKQGDKPAFAVLPYEHYLQLIGGEDKENVYIPHEVVKLCFEKGLTLIAAWRVHKGLSQAELARHLKISQPAVAQLEKGAAKPQLRTLKKLAAALGVQVAQLTE